MKNTITKKEWLEIFPSLWEYLEEQLEIQIKEFDRLVKEMKLQMAMVDRLSQTPEQIEFHSMIREYFVEADIKVVEKKIRNIYGYLRKDNLIGTITDDDIQEAKDKPFGDLIKLKNNKCCCPFHEEKTPSFSVNKQNQGHCFGCGWHGDTIDYIMKVEGVDFIQAVKILK